MDTISLKMPVTIKAKVTEKLKEKMLKELTEGKTIIKAIAVPKKLVNVVVK